MRPYPMAAFGRPHTPLYLPYMLYCYYCNIFVGQVPNQGGGGGVSLPGTSNDGNGLQKDNGTGAVQYFNQCLDHFDTNDNCYTTWSQRYWWTQNNAQDKNSPLFFMLGAEEDISGWADWGGSWYDYAYNYNAANVLLEHRFYGKSTPTWDNGKKAWKLLSSQQAIKDIVRFIRWFKKQYGLTPSKTVVFGASYGGSLAAWVRQKYPSDINIAVSSSGPMSYVLDNPSYYNQISYAIYKSQPACFKSLQQSFSAIVDIMLNGRSHLSRVKRHKLKEALGYCGDDDLTEDYGRQNFIKGMATSWSSNFPATFAAQRCPLLLQASSQYGDIVHAYGHFRRWIGDAPSSCSSRTDGPHRRSNLTRDGSLRDSDWCYWADNNGTRTNWHWFWQTCNEFVNFQTGDSTTSWFSYNWEHGFDVDCCQIWFGITLKDLKRNLKKTYNSYGGKDNYNGTCVIFVNEEYDPWAPRCYGNGDNDNPPSGNQLVWVPKGEHTNDTIYSAGSDQKTARQKVQRYIGTYLHNNNNDNC